jgi:hypothetical protein
MKHRPNLQKLFSVVRKRKRVTAEVFKGQGRPVWHSLWPTWVGQPSRR